jgi:hypothetical protein
MFLQVFFGYGLVEELDSYTEADPDDDVTEQELVAAAMALWVTGRSGDDEDEAEWGGRQGSQRTA